jgi:predicted RNA binding protein YcfA (HicA-like mRNA interferase family)
MRIPRDLSDTEWVKRLARLGYAVARQTGNHLRLTCQTPGEHHVTIPNHDPLRIDALAATLDSVATHRGWSRDTLLEKLL